MPHHLGQKFQHAKARQASRFQVAVSIANSWYQQFAQYAFQHEAVLIKVDLGRKRFIRKKNTRTTGKF
jgi:transposase